MTTVIVPTLNESENISELVRRLRFAGYNDKILVIDDSPDMKTVEAAWKAGCWAHRRTNGRGLSSAVIDGVKFSDDDKIVVMDADLQHPPELVPELIRQLDTHDFVVATRTSHPSMTAVRRMVSVVANLMSWPLAPKVKDRMTGFFGFKRSVINPTSLNPMGWKIGLEIMAKGHYNHIAEVPYSFGMRHHGASKLSKHVIFEYLKQLTLLYFHKFRMLRFAAVGGLGTLTGLLVLFAMTSRLGVHYMGSYLFAFVFVASQNYWLNKRWTFSDRSVASLGYFRYLLVASTTLVLDEALLYAFTELCNIWYMLSATIAITIAFAVRYLVVGKFVWKQQRSMHH